MKSEVYERAMQHFLRGATDRHVVVGPALWHPDGGSYFVIATGRRGMHLDTVQVGKGADICEARDGVLAAFRRRRLIVHDIDDELKTIDACEALWPCPQLVAMRRQFIGEQAFAQYKASSLSRH